MTYRLTDDQGRTATSTYTVTVAKAVTVGAGTPKVTAPRLLRNARAVPATCSLSRGRITASTVTAYALVKGERVAVGSGATAVSGRRAVVVRVVLTELGRALAARIHGVPLTLAASTSQADATGTRQARGTTRVVAPTVALRPVYFGTDSAALRRVDRSYLTRLRTQLAGVRSVTGVGYTDARSTVHDNAALAGRRAVSACQALAHGKRFTVVTLSRGETRSSHTNATTHGRALNRRAEIRLHY